MNRMEKIRIEMFNLRLDPEFSKEVQSMSNKATFEEHLKSKKIAGFGSVIKRFLVNGQMHPSSFSNQRE